MLSSLSIVIALAFIANLFAKQVVVRGIRKLISKLPFANNTIFAEHSVIRRIANIVPAIVIMNGISTVPHLSDKVQTFVQMGAQAFIFLTIALALGELLNIFNLIYQRNPKSRNKPIKGYLQLVKLLIFIVCGLMILGTFLKKDVKPSAASFLKIHQAFPFWKRDQPITVHPCLIFWIICHIHPAFIFKFSKITFRKLFNNTHWNSWIHRFPSLTATQHGTFKNRLYLWIFQTF